MSSRARWPQPDDWSPFPKSRHSGGDRCLGAPAQKRAGPWVCRTSESQLKKLNSLLGNDEPEANQQDQEIALAVHILINQDPSLSEQEVLNRIHIKTADEELPVEGMTEEMAQVLRVTQSALRISRRS